MFSQLRHLLSPDSPVLTTEMDAGPMTQAGPSLRNNGEGHEKRRDVGHEKRKDVGLTGEESSLRKVAALQA